MQMEPKIRARVDDSDSSNTNADPLRVNYANIEQGCRIIPTTLRMIFIPMLLYHFISAPDLQICIQYT